MQTPPSSPRPRSARVGRSWSGTPPARCQPTPSLRLALQKCNLCLVRQALNNHELAAFDLAGESALIFAIRCNCSAEILRLLLAFGADANGPDAAGVTPLLALASAPQQANLSTGSEADLDVARLLICQPIAEEIAFSAAPISEARCCELAAVLLAHSADHSQVCSGTSTPADIAERNGRHGLAGFIRSWSSIQEALGICCSKAQHVRELPLIQPTHFKRTRAVGIFAHSA